MSTDQLDVTSVSVAMQTLLYHLEDQIKPLVAAALKHAESEVSDVQAKLLPVVVRALSSVDVNLPEDGEAAPFDWSAVTRIQSQIDADLTANQSAVDSLKDNALAHVENALTDVGTSIWDVVSAALRGAFQLTDGLLGSLATSEDLWSSMTAVVSDWAVHHKDGASMWSGDVLQDLINRVLGYDPKIVGFVPANHAPDPGSLTDGSPTVEQMITDWQDTNFVTRALATVCYVIANIYNVESAKGASWISKEQQRALALGLPAPLSVSELVGLLRRGEIGEQFATDHAKRSGLSPDLFSLAFKLSRSFLTATDYVEMWRRTGQDSELTMLHAIGVEDEDIERLKVMALAIPTPSDVVRFMARDAYDPAAIAVGKLDDEFDAKYNEEAFRRSGVDRQTALLYWMSHWTLPSPSMYYEMFHRGKITQDQLVAALKVSDYAPGWIDNLVAINYLVPGRIDVRRMFSAGIITTDEELVRRHTDMGYSPEDAATLAGFVKQLKADSDSQAASAKRAPIVRAVIREYVTGITTDEQATEELTGLGLTSDEAQYRLAEGVHEREADRATRIRTAVGREYVRGFLDDAEAMARLEYYQFDPNEGASLLDTWKLDRELSDWSAEKHRQRDLTKAEVIASYEEHILGRDDALASLSHLGYDAGESASLLALADARAARADIAAVVAAVKAEYEARAMDGAEAEQTLAGYGLSQQRISALLTRWTIERDAHRPRVSVSQLETMLKNGVVPKDRLAKELSSRGYTDGDVSLLLTLWGTEMAANADALTERTREFNVREARLGSQFTQTEALATKRAATQSSQFDATQKGLQARFDAAQAATVAAQTRALAARTAAQSAALAAQTARDAAAFASRRELEQRQIDAAAARATAASTAADKRQQAALAQAATLAAQRDKLARDAEASQNTRQQVALKAQSDRLTAQITAANARATAALAEKVQHDATVAAHQTDLTTLRATIQTARDVAANANRIATESRAEQVRVRTELRASDRQTINAANAASNAAELAALKLNRDSAVATLDSQLAALEAAAATRRQATALADRQEAQAQLATLIGTSQALSTTQ